MFERAKIQLLGASEKGTDQETIMCITLSSPSVVRPPRSETIFSTAFI